MSHKINKVSIIIVLKYYRNIFLLKLIAAIDNELELLLIDGDYLIYLSHYILVNKYISDSLLMYSRFADDKND